MAKGKDKINICIDCVKSCGLCSWSANLKPVEGWTATPVRKKYNDTQMMDGFHITACPLFEEAEREIPDTTWTEEELTTLKSLLKQRYRRKDIATAMNKSLDSVNYHITRMRKENNHAPR